jgi:hypothetical protein
MPFFEGKQELYQMLCFVIVPVTVCALFLLFFSHGAKAHKTASE